MQGIPIVSEDSPFRLWKEARETARNKLGLKMAQCKKGTVFYIVRTKNFFHHSEFVGSE